MILAQFVDQLDLNSYEKEIFLFLTGVDNADANSIYKGTKVPKGRIYSVLNSLVEKNFVNIIPTSPKKYKVDNVKESLKNYLHSKKSIINKRLEQVDDLEVKPRMFSLDRNAPSVYTFTGKEEHLNALISLRNRAKKRLIQVAPLFVGTFASNMGIYKALRRGIKVKVITKKVTQGNKKNIKECLRLGANVRYLDSSDLVYFLIKDNNEFILGLENYRNREERLSLYSRNKGLLLVLEEYFEKLWKRSKRIDVSKLESKN